MTLLSFAFKNLKRHRTRTILTIIGIAISSAMLFVILSFESGYKKSLEEELTNTGIHLFVSTEGCPLEAASLIIHGGEIPKFTSEDTLSKIKEMEFVKEVGGFLIFSLISEDGSKVDLFYGITEDVPKLKKNWKLKGEWFKDENSIVLGSEIARVEKRNVGDKIYFESLDKEFTVCGILEKTNSQDDGFYFLPIKTAQKIFKKENKLTAIGVQLTDILKMGEVKSKIESLPDVYVVPAEQMNNEIMRFIGGTKVLMYSILVITIIISTIGLLNTVMMATFERRKEFGYLRCVGARRLDVIRLVVTETLIVCVLGALLGFATIYLLISPVDDWIRSYLPYAPYGKIIRADLFVLIISLGVVLFLGIVAGLYPSLKASNVSPMEAIRNE